MMEDAALKFGKLRPIRPDELDLMLYWRNAPSVRANMYTRHEIGPAEHRAWWERAQACSDKTYFMYESEGNPLGIVAFTDVDRQNQNASWAFYSSPQAPKGTGTKMEFLALEHAFFSMQLHKLFCEVLAFNTPVIKLHQKFGFTVEGILREQHLMDDVFVDIYRLGIRASEWRAQRAEMQQKLSRLTRI